jgi:hypothetical protein
MRRLAALLATAALAAVLAAPAGAADASKYGIESFGASLSGPQAGAHSDFTTTFALKGDPAHEGAPYAATERLSFDLPPGLTGDPAAFPKCTAAQFATSARPFPPTLEEESCPIDSQVGVTHVTIYGDTGALNGSFSEPLYNMASPGGDVVARLGFVALFIPTIIDVRLDPATGYGLTASLEGLSGAEIVSATTTTLWGDPTDPNHDPQRITPYEAVNCGGTPCTASGKAPRKSGLSPTPFMSSPTSCGEPGTATMTAASYALPEQLSSLSAPLLPAITGCGLLDFKPQISLTPTTRAAASPSGMDVELSLPQEGLMHPNMLAEAALKKAAVTLPEGIMLNPSSAGGLTACSEAQIGLVSESPLRFNAADPSCPESSKVGTVEIETPVLPKPIQGSLYIATQNENPSHSLLAGYMVIQGQGALIKLAGSFALDPSTGRITATFDENPQQPFSDLKLHFNGGDRGVLITPSRCGSYTTESVLTPWSAPSGPGVRLPGLLTFDEGCATGGFAPSFTAGTLSNAAGSFSPFVLSFSRGDAEQQIKGLSFTMPPGASAKLAGVPLCSDGNAAAGTCPESSRIGSVTAGSGAGPEPFFLKGSVYLTGPYNGGPFGEAVVVPANAGPFHLGNVVVRGSIGIDPHTAQPTIVSDPFPQFVGSTGIPTDIRRVDVTLDRPGFTFNPTNCEPHAVNGTLTSAQGASATVSSAFQAANCATLRFAPKFQVSTSGKPSKADGASLSARVSYPTAPFGTQANITRVKVDLPKQLPSRLTTLQKACTAAQFESNPAGCPAASVIGHARAITPILPVPLEGPAYFVSHGGEAFPSLIIVLQGYGVRIDLVGTTFINKAGITSSTFKTVPDQPVTSFELTLPQGRFSALASNLPAKAKGSFCGQKLAMPTEFLAQNGAVIHQSTPIGVTGCAKKKALSRAQKLTNAMKACKKKPKAKRAACQTQAHRKYGPLKKKKKK